MFTQSKSILIYTVACLQTQARKQRNPDQTNPHELTAQIKAAIALAHIIFRATAWPFNFNMQSSEK